MLGLDVSDAAQHAGDVAGQRAAGADAAACSGKADRYAVSVCAHVMRSAVAASVAGR